MARLCGGVGAIEALAERGRVDRDARVDEAAPSVLRLRQGAAAD